VLDIRQGIGHALGKPKAENRYTRFYLRTASSNMKTLHDKRKPISAKKKPIHRFIADDHNVIREDLVSLGKRKSKSAKSKNDIQLETSIPGEASLGSIFCTEELRCRPSRPLAEKVLQIVRADSVDLSPVTKDERRFCWAAIAGVGLSTRGRDVLRW
jgi:hypothetical protein